MISIVTAVYNQLGMNKLFVEYLKKYSKLPYELIVIDNNSTDGTKEFYREHADVLIENEVNYAYSHCQNQGIEVAKYDNIAFLNNDLLVSPNWDERILNAMQVQGLDIISFATNEKLRNYTETRAIRNKWKRVKNTLLVLGKNKFLLELMIKIMYGNWERYTNDRYNKFGNEVLEGFSGSCILANKKALDLLNNWDERLTAADFDIYCKSKQRSIEFGDIKPMHYAIGIFCHHYARLTFKSNYPPFADQAKIITLEEKWGDKIEDLLKDVDCN